VARYFHKEQWITDDELKDILSVKTEDPAELFRQNEEDNMSLASQRTPNNSEL
jgi:hypothetical protein